MIYTVFMFLCTVFGIAFASKISNDKRTRITYCTLSGLGLFLIAALRNISVGYDSGQYVNLFNYVAKCSISTILTRFSKEPLFYISLKIISLISKNSNFLFAVIGACFAFVVTYLIYKFSEIPYVSFVMLIPMQFFPFTLSGCRQAIAMSFVIAAIYALIKRSYFKFFVIMIVAYFFHNSVIIALPILLLYLIKDKFVSKILFVLGFFLTYIYRKPLLKFITTYIYTDYDIFDKEAGSFATLFMYIAILIMSAVLVNGSFFRRRTTSNILKQNFESCAANGIDAYVVEKSIYHFFEVLLGFGIIIQIFVPLQPNIFRAAMYYQIASIIIVPKAITNIPNRLLRAISIMFFFLIMAILYFRFTFYSAGANPYLFFWQ